MDRRRLEEGLLLFAALHVIMEYKIDVNSIPYDKDSLLQSVCEQYEKVFYCKWTGIVECLLSEYSDCVAKIEML